jgi:hypothetical protein
MRQAAGFVLALVLVGAAYAVPGSPIRAWVDAAQDWWQARRGAPSAPGPPTPDAAAGLSVAPGRQLVIVFTANQSSGAAHVTLSDHHEVVVRGSLGAAAFTSDTDRLVVNNRGSSATFEVAIPRNAPHVEIHVGGRQVFLKEGERITTGVQPESSGTYRVPLTR